jgi:amino acid transporter
VSFIFYSSFVTASQVKVPVSQLFSNDAWNNATGLPDSWAAFVSILLATLTYTGFDSAAHLAEETKNPSVEGPKSVAYAIIGTFVFGYVSLLGLLVTIDPSRYSELGNEGSYALTIIFQDTVGNTGAIIFNILLMGLAVSNIFGLVLTHARQTFAFSRDGALPGSKWLHVLNKDAVPIRATWAIIVINCIILVSSLFSETLYAAINSFGVIGTYLAYLVPISLRVIRAENFPAGPFNLGSWGVPIGIISMLFLTIASIALVLPTTYVDPAEFYAEDGVTFNQSDYTIAYLESFNWAPVVVGAVTLVALVFWFVSARKWFKGPPIDTETLKSFEGAKGVDEAAGGEGLKVDTDLREPTMSKESSTGTLEVPENR